MSVRIYVEGGGDQRASSARLRQGLAEFIRKVIPSRSQPRLIACGSRNSDLLARIDPAKVRRASRHADELCEVVARITSP